MFWKCEQPGTEIKPQNRAAVDIHQVYLFYAETLLLLFGRKDSHEMNLEKTLGMRNLSVMR